MGTIAVKFYKCLSYYCQAPNIILSNSTNEESLFDTYNKDYKNNLHVGKNRSTNKFTFLLGNIVNCVVSNL